MAVSHVYSQTVADGTATSVVRPSDWNSAHNQYLTISGNTAGQSTMSGTNIVFQGGNNVTLSANTAAGAATVIVSAPNTVAQSVQTQASGNIAGTGFTSTTTGGTAVVGTLSTNGISLGIPAYITTFQNDLTSGRAGTGFTSTTTAGTAVVGTLNTNGLSIGVPAFITTATQSTQTQPAGNIAGAGFTSTTTAGTAVVGTLNSNGLSIGVPTIITNALTTARASNDAVGLNTAATNVTWTVNSAGISINAGAYLTTARASNDAVGLNTALTAGPLAWTVNSGGISLNAGGAAGTSSGFAGNLISGSMTHNTAGLNISLNHPAWLTTAAQSNHSHGNPTLALTNITGTTASASNGLTLSLSGVAAQTTQTQPAGNIAGVGTTFAGTNVSGSMTFNSNGLNLALSAGAGGGGGTQSVYAVSNTTQSSSGTYTNGLSFAGAGIASVGVTNGSVVVSVPSGGGAGDGYNIVSLGSSGNTSGTAWSTLSGSIGIYGGNNITVSQNNSNALIISAPNGGGVGVSNVGNTVGSTGAVSDRVVFAGGNNITLSQSTNGQSATITISANVETLTNWRPFQLGANTSFSSLGQNTVYLQHFIPEQPVTMAKVELWARGSFVSSSNSQVYAQTIEYGLYSQDTGANSTRMTRINTSTMAMSFSYNSTTAAGYTISQGTGSFTASAGNTTILTNMSGPYHLYLPFDASLAPDVKYAFGIRVSSATTVNTGPMRFAPLHMSIMNSTQMAKVYASTVLNTAASIVGDRECGYYNTTTTAMPASYATSNMTINVSRQILYLQFEQN